MAIRAVCVFLAALLPLCLADVALVDIRGTGTAPNGDYLKSSLASTYATAGIPAAGQLLPTADMTFNTAISGSYILEVDSSQATASELDNFWCLHSSQKGLYTTMVETLNPGFTVTEIVTCIGESGTSCTASTSCSGDSGDSGDHGDHGDTGGTPEPEDNKDEGLSTLAIVLIVVGVIIVVGVLIYLLWPMIAPALRQPASVPLTAGLARGSGPVARTGAQQPGNELPPLFAAI